MRNQRLKLPGHGFQRVRSFIIGPRGDLKNVLIKVLDSGFERATWRRLDVGCSLAVVVFSFRPVVQGGTTP